MVWIPRDRDFSRMRQAVRRSDKVGKKNTGIKWNELAQDRVGWKLLVEVFVLQRTLDVIIVIPLNASAWGTT